MKRKITWLAQVLLLGTAVAGAQDGDRDKAEQERAAAEREAAAGASAAYGTHGKIYPPTANGNGEAAAAAQFIPCPVTQIETRVASSLPSDWWDTPQVGKLQGTRVAMVGGAVTLQCLYWAYGQEIPIMKHVPAGLECEAQDQGFRCQ